MALYNTQNNIKLLTSWRYGEEYEKNEQEAKRGACALFRSGVLDFIHGDKPKTGAEFFDGMPYTSSGDFAAVWARANWGIKNKKTGASLDGIAIDEHGRAVSVWTIYDDEKNEIGNDYIIL